MNALASRIDEFWARHPALFVGTALFLGSSAALNFHLLSAADLPLFFALLFLFPYRRCGWALLIMAVAAAVTSLRVHIPREPFSPRTGEIVVEVSDRSLITLHGRPLWKLMLHVHRFRTADGAALVQGLGVPVYAPSPCPLLGGTLYLMPARIHVDDQLQIHVKPHYEKAIVLQKTMSCVEWRVRARNMFRKRLVTLFPDQEIRQVAGALAFGLGKDRFLQQAMHRAGVEHILAVSGFHFGIVAALTAFLCRGIGAQLRALVAMLVLTLYCFIIGPLPSVVRAWCAATVLLGGVLLNRRTSAINSLGVGLIVAVFYDPASTISIGFQLSFLATAAIVFFSRPVLSFLRRIFPQRQMADVIHWSRSDQLALLALEWLLPALSLLIAVSCVVCPYQLAFLQDFSLLGFVYNLLIPALFSAAMPAILLAVLFYPFPIIPQLFAHGATAFLRMGLTLVENAPEVPWGTVDGGLIPPTMARWFIIVLFFAGILFLSREECEDWKACL